MKKFVSVTLIVLSSLSSYASNFPVDVKGTEIEKVAKALIAAKNKGRSSDNKLSCSYEHLGSAYSGRGVTSFGGQYDCKSSQGESLTIKVDGQSIQSADDRAVEFIILKSLTVQ